MGFFSWWAKNISIPSRERPEHLEPPTPPVVPPQSRITEIREVPRALGTAQLIPGSLHLQSPALRAHALDTAGIDDERTPLAVAAFIGGESWTNVILLDADGALLPVDGAAIRVCNGNTCSVRGCTLKAAIDRKLVLTEEVFQQQRDRR